MKTKTKLKFNWLSSLLAINFILILMLIINNLNTYGKLDKNKFIALNIGGAIITLVIIILTIKSNNSNSKIFKSVVTVSLAVLLAFSAYGFYLLTVVNSTIKDITSQDKVLEYHSAFVVKDKSYSTIEQLENKKVGLIASEKFIEGHTLPIDELEKLEYTDVKKKEYASYPLLINALLKDEVDFIALPRDYETLFITDDHIAPELENLSTVHSFSGKYENASIIGGSDIDVTTVPFTMLIMGNDGGRTDSLMLASVNPAIMQITLTSIARDSYVPIACYPNQHRDKINHARTINRECTIETVENLMDIKIDFFIEISFEGLVDLVDALGTIPIDSPASFHGNIERPEGGGVFIPEGMSDLNGDQVLAFVRERKSFEAGDFQRQQNQQQAIGSLISTVAETRSVDTLMKLVKATGKNVETNLALPQLIDLMNLALQRMESTYLDPSDLVTIYGNRITGQGVMNYSPEYGFDLYYYVLYDGSIEDARALIDMNMRADGVLTSPKGFNYSVNDEYRPPQFGKLEYDEYVDKSIFYGAGVEVDNGNNATDKPEEKNDEVALKELNGLSRAEAETYLKSYGFSYNDAGTSIVETDQISLDQKEVVASFTSGVILDSTHSVVNLKFIKYQYKEKPVEPKPDPKPDPNPNPEPTEPSEGDDKEGSETEKENNN